MQSNKYYLQQRACLPPVCKPDGPPSEVSYGGQVDKYNSCFA